MKYWSLKRRISFFVHVIFVAVPFCSSTISALLFWESWFNSWIAASVLVSVIEVLALSSLVLYISRIEWPLAWMRHALPFISIVPLGWELYLLLAPNGILLAGILSMVITVWFVALAFLLFRSLERLFIDPEVAMQESTIEQLESFHVNLLRLASTFVQVRDEHERVKLLLNGSQDASAAIVIGESRKSKILRLIDDGKSDSEIARVLGISRQAVQQHRSKVLVNGNGMED